MNKVIVLTGSIVGIAYLTELFMAWYSAVPYENFAFFENRLNLNSPYAVSYTHLLGLISWVPGLARLNLQGVIPKVAKLMRRTR